MTRLASRFTKLALLAPALFLAAANTAQAAEHGVHPSPDELFHIGSLPVTNSMVTTWFFSLVFIIAVRWIVGNPKLIPTRGQTLVENTLQPIRDIMETIVGKRMIDKVFPLLISFFLFILIMNLSGLLPGVGAFGRIEDENGHATLHYFFRPANSDLNTTLALTIVSFVAWIYFVLRYAGFKALLLDLFGNKADKKDVHIILYFMLFPVFFLVGFIEIISILSRLLSLSFRLYGNVFGGESLLDAMYNIFPYGLPVIFYFMELMVAVVQAFVFTVLTAVYIGLICNHEGGHDEEHDEEHGAASHENDVKVVAHN